MSDDCILFGWFITFSGSFELNSLTSADKDCICLNNLFPVAVFTKMDFFYLTLCE